MLRWLHCDSRSEELTARSDHPVPASLTNQPAPSLALGRCFPPIRGLPLDHRKISISKPSTLHAALNGTLQSRRTHHLHLFLLLLLFYFRTIVFPFHHLCPWISRQQPRIRPLCSISLQMIGNPVSSRHRLVLFSTFERDCSD